MPKTVKRVMKEREMQHLISKVDDFLLTEKKLKFLRNDSNAMVSITRYTRVSKPEQF